MKELYSLDHVLDCSFISNLILGNTTSHRKLQDSIVVSFLMCELGILPRSNKIKGSIFKKYLSGIKYNLEKLNMEFNELEEILKTYEYMEYGSCKHSNLLIDYLKK